MTTGFIERMKHHLTLSERECEVLESLESVRVEVRRGQTVLSEGDRVNSLFFLNYGWALCEYCAEDGRRQMTQIHLPGDVMCFPEIHRKRSAHRLIMKTDGSYSRVPLTRLAEVFTTTPRLGTVFLAFLAEEQMAQSQQLHAQANLSARERLIVFLLSVRERLSLGRLGTVSRFHLPMTQVEIARYLGLTPVWVSRLFRELRETGQIAFEDHHIRFLEPESLAAEVGYKHTRSAWNTDWFPPAQVISAPSSVANRSTTKTGSRKVTPAVD